MVTPAGISSNEPVIPPSVSKKCVSHSVSSTETSDASLQENKQTCHCSTGDDGKVRDATYLLPVLNTSTVTVIFSPSLNKLLLKSLLTNRKALSVCSAASTALHTDQTQLRDEFSYILGIFVILLSSLHFLSIYTRIVNLVQYTERSDRAPAAYNKKGCQQHQ